MAFFEMMVGGSVIFYYLILWNEFRNQKNDTESPRIKNEIIASLRKIKIGQNQLDECSQCPICYDDFKLQESVTQLQCRHIFHENCITTWLGIHATCPLCRNPQNDNSEAHDSKSHYEESIETVPNLVRTYFAYLYKR